MERRPQFEVYVNPQKLPFNDLEEISLVLIFRTIEISLVFEKRPFGFIPDSFSVERIKVGFSEEIDVFCDLRREGKGEVIEFTGEIKPEFSGRRRQKKLRKMANELISGQKEGEITLSWGEWKETFLLKEGEWKRKRPTLKLIQ